MRRRLPLVPARRRGRCCRGAAAVPLLASGPAAADGVVVGGFPVDVSDSPVDGGAVQP